MGSIKLNEFKFDVKDTQVKVSQFDKVMGMFEELKTYPASELVGITQDFTIKTYRTVVIPKLIMENLSAYLKSQEV